MQIHELPNGVPSVNDYLPIDNGTSTRKAPFSAFEAGDNPVTFESGDSDNPSVWQDADIVETGTLKGLLTSISKTVSNVRWMFSRFIYPTMIPENADINNYVDPGNYFCAGRTIAETHSHAPFNNSSYQMLVFKMGLAYIQTFQIAWQNALKTSLRYRMKTDQDDWGDWIILAKQEDVAPIGDIVQSTSQSGTKSISNATATNITSITLPAGRWVLIGHVTFNPGGTAGTYRKAMIGNVSGGSGTAQQRVAGLSSGTTVLSLSGIAFSSSPFTMYLGCEQGSGSSITINLGSCSLNAIRIK